MSILDRIRNRSAPREAAETGPDEAGAPDEHQLPIARYDRLDAKEVASQLSGLTQVELAAVETYERRHGDRAVVLDKLRYLCTAEPLPGYDTLDSDQVVQALAGADGQTLRAVRDYERKFRRRPAVAAEITRTLPSSQPSAAEGRAQEEKDARVRTKAGS
jgi:hypothetical protein